MGYLLHAVLAQGSIVKAPADVIMAAQIVEEGVLLWQTGHSLQLLLEQSRVSGGHRVPDAGHGGHIVEHMALRLLHGSEVGGHLLRLHHHLAKKQHAGADNLPDHAHHPHNGVHLGQIAAAGPQLLPYIGHRVDADHIDAPIGQEEEIVHHLIEYHGIFVIQIPLVGVKGGEHVFSHLWKPRKVSWGCGGKDLGHSPLIGVHVLLPVIEEIPVHVLPLPVFGPPRPLVILGGMVHHKVQADADPLAAAFVRQSLQILNRPQLLLHLPEIRHRVSPVGAARRALKKGHQMEIVHPAPLDIVQLLPHTGQCAAEIPGVHHHAQHAIFLKPGGILLPLFVLAL